MWFAQKEDSAAPESDGDSTILGQRFGPDYVYKDRKKFRKHGGGKENFFASQDFKNFCLGAIWRCRACLSTGLSALAEAECLKPLR